MNPTTLQQFGSSDDAKGIMAGFEAELVFTGLGGEGDYDEDPEPDYDADERCNSVQQVIDFFSYDEYGYGTSGRDLDQLQEGLDEKYMEWSDEKMYDAFRDEQEDLIRKIWLDEKPWAERLHAALVDGLDVTDAEADRIAELGENRKNGKGKAGNEYTEEELDMLSTYSEAAGIADDILDEDVEQSIAKQDGYYDSALDDFRDGFYVDDDSGFFGDVGLRWMSDVANEFSLMWPVVTYTGQSSEGGWNESEAERLADDLHERLGVKTKVSGGYHSATRDDKTWIFEPDSSLDSDDSDNMAIEIVSPPMPLETCLRFMEDFFEWAEDNGAYSNSSTGFHMGVSLPHRGGDVDYVKLALFLGDEHVLQEFGRAGNSFCEAAMKKIRNRVKGNKEAVGSALTLMRSNLLELAQKALEINNHGFGKYTSINPKGGTDSTHPHKERGAKYIEFRSAGGSNYFEDIDKLKNTLLRYAKAMSVAANPAEERREYYKKLYKLISPPEGDPALDLFSRFATGEISSADLKKSWAEKQLETEPKGDWVLYDSYGKRVQGQTYNGYTKSEAWERAKQKLSPGGSMEGFQKEYRFLPSNSESGDWEVYNTDTGKTLEVLRGYETRGAAADAVYDKYVTDQGIPFNLRPVDPEAPEKPLTKRERLAKNIKSAPAEPVKNWKIYDTKTGDVHYEQEGRKSSLVQIMRKFERDHKLPQGQLAIEEIPGKDADKDEPLRTWEIVDRMDNNKVLDTVGGTEAEAERVRKTWVRQAGRGEDSNIGKRSVPTDASRERYEDRGNWEFFYEPTGRVLDRVTDISQTQARSVLADVQRRYGDLAAPSIQMRKTGEVHDTNVDVAQNFDTPPTGFQTQRPATGDYYEVKSGDRIYGYLSTQAATDNNRSAAIEIKRYIEQLTGRDDAQLVYRAGDPVQSTAPNGVPMWEVYERDSGHVVHAFADHDQTSAWSTAQAWLRSVGAEDPSLFSCRPKMST
jgi:hypothetical protein